MIRTQNIDGIDGLTVEQVRDGKRIVKYNGAECPLINRKEVLCEQDTSYRGSVIDSWETYKTPIGIVERHYWARGGELERYRTDWRLMPVEEITAAQKRFEAASIEIAAASQALEMVAGK